MSESNLYIVHLGLGPFFLKVTKLRQQKSIEKLTKGRKKGISIHDSSNINIQQIVVIQWFRWIHKISIHRNAFWQCYSACSKIWNLWYLIYKIYVLKYFLFQAKFYDIRQPDLVLILYATSSYMHIDRKKSYQKIFIDSIGNVW